MASEYTQLHNKFNNGDHCELLDRNKIQIFFEESIKYSHLEVARWLHKVGINIHYDNDHAFIYSCLHGHLEIAQWLHKADADIHAHDDQAFIYSCDYNRPRVAEWLCSLCDEYYIEVVDDQITKWKFIDWFDILCTADSLKKHLRLQTYTNQIQIRDHNCLICCDTANIILTCGHSLCSKCLVDWYLKKGNVHKCVYCSQTFKFNECYVK